VALCSWPAFALAEPNRAPSAETPSEERVAEAKARYQEGARAYAEQRYKDAVDLFLEADRIVSSAPLSFNIARAYEKLGDSSGALAFYRDYLRREPGAKNAAEVRGFIEILEDKLAQKGVQQLSVRSTPKGATVVIDGEPVGVTPWTGDLPPGAHRLALELRGYGAASRDVELSPHDALDTEFVLEAAAESERATSAVPLAPPPARAPEPERAPSFGVWPYVALGASAAALGGALYFEIARQDAEDDARGEPTQIGYHDAYERMQARQTVSRVLVGVGGALGLTGGALIVIELASKPKDARTEAVLGCGPLGCALTARGRF
jgi:tetratricopeptide (TPR) repeat protein